MDLTEDIRQLLTEAEDIKKWQYTEELYKKDLHDPNNHNGHSPRAKHPGM